MSTRQAGPHLRFTNSVILILLSVLVLTGVYGLFWNLNGWLYDLHRGAAWALVAVVPFKVGISWRSLKRGFSRTFNRSVMIGVSLTAAVLVFGVLILGLLWTWRIGPEVLWLGQSGIAWHWIAALILVPLVALHVWRRWPKPKPGDFTLRRHALRALGFAGFGLVGWWLAETVSQARATPQSPRAFTGSRGYGSLTGNLFPVTGEWANPLDVAQWALTIHGAVAAERQLRYEDILAMAPLQVEATIDCTNGWYSRQQWQGPSLMAVLDSLGLNDDAHFVRIKSSTGYAATFSLDEAREILLATHVGGQPLDHWHGYPVRSVAPSWRGWYWVKWVSDVEVLTVPHFDLPGII